MDLKQLTARLDQIENNKLYEGLTLTETKSVILWENASRAIKEAALTPDQIEQLFTSVEQGATAAGGNRTMIGKGKDAASAVNQAWEDLKAKVQSSGPVQNVDKLYDQAAEKLKQATGGDQGVMKYVQKYRDFAKKHPIAQSLIYSALIAAAGISGAGLGGAAALGLFKMVDKLLQGEKFSSAAYSGAKTGAMAYAAGQIGKAIRGDQAPAGGATDAAGTPIKGARGLADEADRIFREKVANGEVTDYNSYQQGMQDSLDQALQNAGGKMSFQSQETARMILKAKLDNVVAQGNGGQFTGSGPEKAAELIKQLGGQVNADTVAQQTSAAAQMAQNNAASGAFNAASGALNTAGDVAQSIGSKPPISVNLPGGEMKFADRAAYDAWQNGQQLKQVQMPGGAVYSLPQTAIDQAADVAQSSAPIDYTKPGPTSVDSAGQKLEYGIPINDKGAFIAPNPNLPPEELAQQTTAYNAWKQNYMSRFPNATLRPDGTMQAFKPGLAPMFPGGNRVQETAGVQKKGQKLVQTRSKKLSESQIYLIIDKVVEKQKLKEGITDTIKGAAGKAANWAATKGKNLTTKITADKLLQAWKKAGSPTDSEEVAKILQNAGVDPAVISKAFSDMSLPAPGQAATSAPTGIAVNTKDILAQILKLTLEQQKQVLAHLKK